MPREIDCLDLPAMRRAARQNGKSNFNATMAVATVAAGGTVKMCVGDVKKAIADLERYALKFGVAIAVVPVDGDGGVITVKAKRAGDYAALEQARIARGGRDGTTPVQDDSKPYGGRVRETTADGLRFKFKFKKDSARSGVARSPAWDLTRSTIRPQAVLAPGEGLTSGHGGQRPEPRRLSHGGGFGHMSPERRREISRKANAARWGR